MVNTSERVLLRVSAAVIATVYSPSSVSVGQPDNLLDPASNESHGGRLGAENIKAREVEEENVSAETVKPNSCFVRADGTNWVDKGWTKVIGPGEEAARANVKIKGKAKKRFIVDTG